MPVWVCGGSALESLLLGVDCVGTMPQVVQEAMARMGRVVEAGSSAELVKRGAVRATMEAMARNTDSAPVQVRRSHALPLCCDASRMDP